MTQLDDLRLLSSTDTLAFGITTVTITLVLAQFTRSSFTPGLEKSRSSDWETWSDFREK